MRTRPERIAVVLLLEQMATTSVGIDVKLWLAIQAFGASSR